MAKSVDRTLAECDVVLLVSYLHTLEHLEKYHASKNEIKVARQEYNEWRKKIENLLTQAHRAGFSK